jgi:ferredoxin
LCVVDDRSTEITPFPCSTSGAGLAVSAGRLPRPGVLNSTLTDLLSGVRNQDDGSGSWPAALAEGCKTGDVHDTITRASAACGESLARRRDSVASIRFVSSGVDKTIRVDVAADERSTLLAVAKASGVPLLFNCESGDCSACVVHVETRAVGTRPVAPMTEKERFLLPLIGLLTEPEIEKAERLGVSADVRLACQYALGEEDIVVFFKSGLAG